MCRVTDQEQVPVLHGFDHQAAQRSNALFQRRAGDQARCHVFRQAGLEFGPEALVGPVLHAFIQRYLQVVAAACLRTLTAQRKATLVMGVDQFVVHWGRIGQHP
ncbi:hypothetical protein D3C81_1663230 [compost metagenome]